MTTQVNLSMVSRVNLVENTMTSRLRDFVRMNPPIFLGFIVGEDPQEFIDGVYKVLSATGFTSRDKAELTSYQLRDLAMCWSTVDIDALSIHTRIVDCISWLHTAQVVLT